MRTARRCCVATRSENFSRAASRSPARTSAFTAAAMSESFERTRAVVLEPSVAARRAWVLIQDYGEPSRNVYSINNIRYDRLFLSRETPRSQEEMTIQVERAHGLEALGIVRAGHVHWNLSPAALYEEAL